MPEGYTREGFAMELPEDVGDATALGLEPKPRLEPDFHSIRTAAPLPNQEAEAVVSEVASSLFDAEPVRRRARLFCVAQIESLQTEIARETRDFEVLELRKKCHLGEYRVPVAATERRWDIPSLSFLITTVAGIALLVTSEQINTLTLAQDANLISDPSSLKFLALGIAPLAVTWFAASRVEILQPNTQKLVEKLVWILGLAVAVCAALSNAIAWAPSGIFETRLLPPWLNILVSMLAICLALFMAKMSLRKPNSLFPTKIQHTPGFEFFKAEADASFRKIRQATAMRQRLQEMLALQEAEKTSFVSWCLAELKRAKLHLADIEAAARLSSLEPSCLTKPVMPVMGRPIMPSRQPGMNGAAP